SGETGSSAPVSAPTPLARTDPPELRASVVSGGLSHVWDLGFLPDGRVLLTQRDGRIAMLSGTQPGARVTPVAADQSDVYVRGEGGLMGMVVHPDFAQSR